MPTPEAVTEQIREVVAEAGFEHGVIGDDQILMVRAPEAEGTNRSTFVSVRCEQVRETSVIVFLHAVVLVDIPDEDETKIKAALIMNDLNTREVIGRWVFYVDSLKIELEYELLGDFLAEGDILASISALGFSSDKHDELLREELGGRRPIDPPDSEAQDEA